MSRFSVNGSPVYHAGYPQPSVGGGGGGGGDGSPGGFGDPDNAPINESIAFSTPSFLWTVNHNLGVKPSVQVYNSGSQEVMADVIHVSVNQLTVSFSKLTSGFVILT